ncbi:hypothetical protein [Aeoliella sp. SH292]|uniref:hypothetical protein n=1 Tax=Aeoliella sp. SH292 TaxID=3454464 RepID=UPI003F94CD7F
MRREYMNLLVRWCPKWKVVFAYATCVLSWIGGLATNAQDFSQVPGVVIDHSPKSSGSYIGSPSIAILPNGDYVATHDVFGNGSNKSSTLVFHSSDKGDTWTRGTTLQGQYWSNLFVQDDELYIMGTSREYGQIVIRKSTDGGLNWTTPSTASSGLLKSGNIYHTAPMPVIEHDGRLWRGFEDISAGGGWGRHFRSFVMSAPIGADLLDADSWTYTNALASDTTWLDGKVRGWLEGGVVVDRDDRLVNMLRVDNVPAAAMVKVEDENTISFDQETGFVDFPGGAKKFTIRYDAISDKYWTLSNPVLPQHQGSPDASTRNALALMSSDDLHRWEVQSVLLYHPDVAKHGFQYVDWHFEGNDIVAASRTAYDDGLGGANNNHDANFMTFHRFEEFRELAPSQALVADTNNNRILRYQANTEGEWIPLGNFVSGTIPGGALESPMGLVQDANGFVYVGEQKDGGRILRFDGVGNFVEVVATSGVDFQGRPEGLVLGSNGQLLLSTAFGSNSDRVISIDPESRSTQVLVDTTFAGGTLNNPRGLAVDGQGGLYVANRNGNNVLKFDESTGNLIEELWQVDTPQALAWDTAAGELKVSALANTDLFRVAPNGEASTLYDPNDIGTVLGMQVIDGQLFWTDYSNGTISRLTGLDAKATVAAGLSGPGHLIGVSAPRERVFVLKGVGLWSDPTNWQTYWGVANTAEEIAVVGPGLVADQTVILERDQEIGGLRLMSEHRVALAGPGALTLAAGEVQVFAGSHELQVPVRLASDITFDLAASTQLTLNNTVSLDGHTLLKTGAGELTLNGQVRTQGGAIVLEEGTINGSGQIEGSLSNMAAIVAPGNSPGTLTIRGDYLQAEEGALEIELAGTSMNQYDHLVVEGALVASGQLSVQLLDSFMPNAGDTFDIVSYGSLQSDFTRVSLPTLRDGLSWQVSHLNTSGTLRLTVVPEPSALGIAGALLGIAQLRYAPALSSRMLFVGNQSVKDSRR